MFCSKCGSQTSESEAFCAQCSAPQTETSRESNPAAPSSPTYSVPAVFAVVLYGMAAISAIGGIKMSYDLLPGDPGVGMVWKAVAYTPAVTMLSIGLVQGTLLVVFGQALLLLERIELNTRKK